MVDVCKVIKIFDILVNHILTSAKSSIVSSTSSIIRSLLLRVSISFFSYSTDLIILKNAFW